ncbi:MAG: HlyD family efflux transporter periplasmic adaptor subunit [Acidobacteria bacterium]|nr:MAG: HlyD family efflux transporter periplasmic adaptor subunit [Acidobacteriota bacterium]
MNAGRAVLVLGAATAAACAFARSPRDPVPAFEVRPGPFELRIEARGRLHPADATPIEAPSVRARAFLAWLAPDASRVAAGDLLFRIDDRDLRMRLERARAKVERIERQIAAKRRALEKERRSIEGEIALVARELEDAETAAPRDPRLFPRAEIIDAEANVQLLRAKRRHLENKLARYRDRARAELEILESERKTEAIKVALIEKDIARLEVRAPHAGIFYHRRYWNGEPIRVGATLWGGMEVGELAGVDRLEARVHVLESEAAGLAEGLPATVRPLARPDLEISGRVKQIEPVAKPIEEGSPVKYFTVVLSLEPAAGEGLRAGGRVSASISVARLEHALAVPNQAIFTIDGEPAVFVATRAGFEPRRVVPGRRSASRTVIVEGLEAGARVALVDPRKGGPA